ncbi:cytochrome c maturation protein CcmE domain-containing protein [Propionispira raffinosivorans]|uniref:cytochrome c maturation protein CcmE domain-containing protein n=1 Tax=Propionispira raffinosivorans TaxID=86959 RepID=UPI0003759A21|nr:cytochrome c maturation protein CcmE [Propionispira raffinosivorans]
MNKRHVFILVLIVLVGGYSMHEFSASLNPYITISKVKVSHSTVQVKGHLVKDEASITYDAQRMLHFNLMDEAGELLAVSYAGEKPRDFERATDVVVIGKYENQQFHADKILIKCPSKYQKEGTLQ